MKRMVDFIVDGFYGSLKYNVHNTNEELDWFSRCYLFSIQLYQRVVGFFKIGDNLTEFAITKKEVDKQQITFALFHLHILAFVVWQKFRCIFTIFEIIRIRPITLCRSTSYFNKTKIILRFLLFTLIFTQVPSTSCTLFFSFQNVHNISRHHPTTAILVAVAIQARVKIIGTGLKK